MAKIFAAQAELNNHPSRNNFDLSHKVHMSGKMGLIYPVFCKPVVPGDSFRIDSGCAFNFMPMPYPTQTRMRFIQHFFYVRNKNLWKNWENWLQGLPDNETGETPVPPYIDQPASFYKTGALADFLGIPTTLKKLDSSDVIPFQTMPNIDISILGSLPLDVFRYQGINPLSGKDFIYGDSNTKYYSAFFSPIYNNLPVSNSRYRFSFGVNSRFACNSSTFLDLPPVLAFRVVLVGFNNKEISLSINEPVVDFMSLVSAADDSSARPFISLYELGYTDNVTSIPFDYEFGGQSVRGSQFEFALPDFSFQIKGILDSGLVSSYFLAFVPCFLQYLGDESYDYSRGLVYLSSNNPSQDILANSSYANLLLNRSGLVHPSATDGVEMASVPEANPFYSSTNVDEDTIKLSALPFRAYESIYNAFYRNTNGNQPFMIDGKIQYNKYNTTLDDGADTTDYELFHRNWELDAYTSALPSPQQGAAPVVGISALGEVTIVDPETGVTTTARATDTPNGMQISDVNLGDQSHQSYLINLATSGITINDFRNVNALQRFLETNIRKGYKYMDFIEGHFGSKIKGAILDMPEFIGGFNQSVDVNMISNMTAGKVNNVETLGDYGGQASAFGGTKHTINHYCDDYGFIIGVLTLVPEPTYSQILPKHFNIKQPLDYYFPEFAQIGMQPITYEELCPIQSHLEHRSDPNKKLTDVFGYQRPNHDLVWYPDTLHGEFRKSFSNYVINRMYTERPQLGNEFLTIKPEETNTIFNYTAPDEDVFLGQVAFNVQAKRPIPRIVIPSLGR